MKLIQQLWSRFLNRHDDGAGREFDWCIVGNIVDRHYYGMEKEIMRGTKHFRPNTKVYCLPEFGGMAHERIRVMGQPRKSRRMIEVVIQSRLIGNFRVQKVYKPGIRSAICDGFYYRDLRGKPDEVEQLERMATYLTTLTEALGAANSSSMDVARGQDGAGTV